MARTATSASMAPELVIRPRRRPSAMSRSSTRHEKRISPPSCSNFRRKVRTTSGRRFEPRGDVERDLRVAFGGGDPGFVLGQLDLGRVDKVDVVVAAGVEALAQDPPAGDVVRLDAEAVGELADEGLFRLARLEPEVGD